MSIDNKGNGIYIDGWDGWIINSTFAGNGGAGIYDDKKLSAITMTANRIEWNKGGGIYLGNTDY